MAPPDLSRIQVPPYWLDPEVGKMFKVEPDTTSPPGFRYSQSAVKKKIQEQILKDLSRQKESELTSRSKLLRHPISASFHRELGHHLHRPSLTDAVTQTYVAGLDKFQIRSTDLVAGSNPSITRKITNNPRLHPALNAASSMFIHDVLTDGWIIGGSTGFSTSKISTVLSPWSQHPKLHDHTGDEDRPLYPRSAQGVLIRKADLMHYQAELSSLETTPSRILVATTLGSSVPSTVHVMQIADPRDYTEQNGFPLDNEVHAFVALPRRQEMCTIWSSAPNPFAGGPSANSADQLAVGTSQGISLLDLTAQRWTRYRDPNIESHLDEIKSVSWMSPHVIAGGGKRGKVLLWDTRTNKNDLNFTHDHLVLNIKCIPQSNGPYMVVVGHYNSLNLYDLRFGRPTAPHQGPRYQNPGPQPPHEHRYQHQGHSNQHPAKRPRWQHHTQQPSTAPPPDRYLQPVLTFDYENNLFEPGMDIRSDVLAIGDGNRCICLYSLITGALLKSIPLHEDSSEYTFYQSPRPARCIRFVDEPGRASYVRHDPSDVYMDEDNKAWRMEVLSKRNLNAGRTALAASVGGEIVVYAWEDENDDEA